LQDLQQAIRNIYIQTNAPQLCDFCFRSYCPLSWQPAILKGFLLSGGSAHACNVALPEKRWMRLLMPVFIASLRSPF
jgi:hypothetical protein